MSSSTREEKRNYKIKPLYDFLREDLKITVLFLEKGSRQMKIFEASDQEIIGFAKSLPGMIELNGKDFQALAEKIHFAEN